MDQLLLGYRNDDADLILLLLASGATTAEATRRTMQQALRTGTTAAINTMNVVGLVAIPGMMTGQILAGADPATAVRYQILVMLMLVASTAIGSILVVHIVRRLCFTKAHQMIV